MTETLREYKKKRHFDKTDEPSGTTSKKSSKRLRFVVQHHIASRDHYDFRLEWDGVLKSWAVPKGPSYDPRDKRLAVQVEDHPFDYRTFEGTIPKGEYGGGTVMIWDQGSWRPLVEPEQGLADGSLKFILEGERLKGKWALVRMASKKIENGNNWLLIKEKDDYVNDSDIREFTTSIVSGRTMEEIGEGASAEKTGTKKAGATKKPASSPRNSSRAADIVLDGVTITNPGKILYQEANVGKGDVASYYHKVADRMLPYLGHRVVSAVRCPGGVGGSCFYKKHPVKPGPGVVSVPVPGKGEKSEEYFYVEDVRGLMSEVQMNTLEFHAWASRVETLEKPDLMTFDLDPDEGVALEVIRRGVRDLKGLLDNLSLQSFLKTSGGKGYHVVIPFKPAAGWDAFYDFARTIAKTMEAQWPDRYTSNQRKIRRSDRIFIDWLRNGRGATSVAPYSLRAREGAGVSMPIPWKELDAVAPDAVTMKEALARLRRKDPWSDFFTIGQQLK